MLDMPCWPRPISILYISVFPAVRVPALASLSRLSYPFLSSQRKQLLHLSHSEMPELLQKDIVYYGILSATVCELTQGLMSPFKVSETITDLLHLQYIWMYHWGYSNSPWLWNVASLTVLIGNWCSCIMYLTSFLGNAGQCIIEMPWVAVSLVLML